MAKKKPARAPATASLLVELLTEELPPKSLRLLGEAFAEQLVAEIVRHRLKDRVPTKQVFATPRRLAVLIQDVRAQGLDSEHEGPVSSNSRAVEGFAKNYNVAPELLERRQTSKGEIVVAKMSGVKLDAVLPGIVEKIIKKLPVSKIMRWGEGDAEFVRPVHGLVMLHGSRVVPGKVLGRESTNQTSGHRFLSATPLNLKRADGYEGDLRGKGNVIASFTARRDDISKQLADAAGGDAALVADDALLDEITALVEAPAVYAGEFSTEFLAVPEECLILSMQQHQKYVPLRDKMNGKLLPRFLFVANLSVKDPSSIVHGNERVLRARLADAKFFYDQDRKVRLEERVPQLADIVYHNKLGSQRDRAERVRALAKVIATEIGTESELADRAALLAKADLVTNMVGEFPELQGIMGRYYALVDGEDRRVADAIEQHYRPRYAGDQLPEKEIATTLALADKLETLIGMFGIGQLPTGDKDPFALRRHALGILRILLEKKLPFSLDSLLKRAHESFPKGLLVESHENKGISIPNHLAAYFFVEERAKGYLRDHGYSTSEIEAVLSLRVNPSEYIDRLNAVRRFLSLAEATELAESDKRIRNILTKSGGNSIVALTNESLLTEDAERKLLNSVRALRPQVDTLIKQTNFEQALLLTAQIHLPVKRFFDDVMVNVEDKDIRENRFALLHEVNNLTNRVANLSALVIKA